MVSKQEKEVLRQLAQRYMQYASLPVQKEKIRLWKALNRGEMERPMVCIDQIPWYELNDDGFFNPQVEDPVFRSVEIGLKQKIYQWEHFPVDMVLDPYIVIPLAFGDTGIGISADRECLASEKGNETYAQHFNAVIKDMEDIEKIKDPVIWRDDEKSREWLEEAREIFNGIAPVEQSAGIQFHLGVWDNLTELLGGVQDIYYDFIDRPEFLHSAVERITQSRLSAIEQCNKLGLHNDTINTCHCSYIYTDELLPDSGMGKGPYSKNCWAFGLAQLFSSVSPELMEEFEAPYINRMAEHFGMIYYGCCDRLDDRLDWVKKIPNIRKVSCSPWSNREVFAEKIGQNIVMSNKPSPAFIGANDFDREAVRKDLKRTYDAARHNNVNLEFILKDISTIRHEPERLDEWACIAMEVVSG